MKKLLVLTFAVSSLLRPSLVLCMEPTGNVRVEFQEAFCCAEPQASSDIAVGNAPAGDCEGCLDVSLATHSLVLKRPTQSVMPTGAAMVLPNAFSSSHSVLVATHTLTHSPSTLHSRILSTTVIRC